jgi:hypothetical protein
VVRGPPVVHGDWPGGARAVSEEKAFLKLYQALNEWKIEPQMSVLKLPLLVDHQQKVCERVLSLTSCPSIVILEKTLNYFTEKCSYVNVNHRYCVFPIHSHGQRLLNL